MGGSGLHSVLFLQIIILVPFAHHLLIARLNSRSHLSILGYRREPNWNLIDLRALTTGQLS